MFYDFRPLWVPIGSPNGTLWVTSGLHLGANKGPLDGLGLKVGPGSLKVRLLRAFWEPFVSSLGGIFNITAAGAVDREF